MSRWSELPIDPNDVRRAAVQLFIDRCSTERRFFWEGRQSYAEIDGFRSSIFDAIHWCQENGWAREQCALVTSIADYLYVKGYWTLAVSIGLHSSELAKANGMLAEASWILVHLVGYVSANRGDVSTATNAFESAFSLSREAGDKVGQSDALRHLARTYRKGGWLDRARETYKLAYSYLERSNLRLQRALTINELGKLERDSKNFNGALVYFGMAIDELQDTDSSVGAGIKCNISGVALSLSDLASAEAYAREALEHFEAVDNVEGMASCLDRLARISHRRDNYDDAKIYGQRAAELYSRLGMESEAGELLEIRAL
jgi:tetratricopeptide (TPR) repeat protein